MAFNILLTRDATADLENIYNYIRKYDAKKQADYVLDKIAEVFNSLAEAPHRGSYPGELSAIGIREYREIYFKPYRIIYRVIGQKVFIFMIADERRDMQTLLQSRLLES